MTEWLVCTYISSCSLVTSGSGQSALVLQDNLSGLPGKQTHTQVEAHLDTVTHLLDLCSLLKYFQFVKIYTSTSPLHFDGNIALFALSHPSEGCDDSFLQSEVSW